MKTPHSLAAPLLVGLFALLLTQSIGQSQEPPRAGPVPDTFKTKLQALFKKYYPKADTVDRNGSDGIHIEYNLTTYEFPPKDPSKKHENPIQRGPLPGGIQCNVSLNNGSYAGQLSHFGTNPEWLLDKTSFKQYLAAPYSPKRDQHLWLSLSYPADTNEKFLEEFKTLLNDFRSDAY